MASSELGKRVAVAAVGIPLGVLAIYTGGWALGALLGLIGARWGAKLIGSQLYGVQQTDVTSFAVSAAALIAIALLACLLPVRRAVRVDPMIAMRAD